MANNSFCTVISNELPFTVIGVEDVEYFKILFEKLAKKIGLDFNIL